MSREWEGEFGAWLEAGYIYACLMLNVSVCVHLACLLRSFFFFLSFCASFLLMGWMYDLIANLLQVQNRTRKFIFWLNWVWFNFNYFVVLWGIFGSLASGFVGDLLCHMHLQVFVLNFGVHSWTFVRIVSTGYCLLVLLFSLICTIVFFFWMNTNFSFKCKRKKRIYVITHKHEINQIVLVLYLDEDSSPCFWRSKFNT